MQAARHRDGGRRSSARATTSTPTSRRATSRGTSASAWSPTATCSRAIRAGRASVVTDTIDRFTADGIRLASGATLAADIVVVATGLKLNLLGDIALDVDGQRASTPARRWSTRA